MMLCSACLLGIGCRYDGKTKNYPKVLELSKKEVLIPICPEQLGGLPTPRDAAEQKGGKVFTVNGADMTEAFNKGAEEVLKIAKILNIKRALLKQRSPSCGSKQVYDGSFSRKLIDGSGVTSKLLKANGIEVFSEEEL